MRQFRFRLPFVTTSTRSPDPKRSRAFDTLDERLRNEAPDARKDMPDNLIRRTLDALQDSADRPKPGFLHHWPMIVAPAGFGAVVLSILLLSVQTPSIRIDSEPDSNGSSSQTFSLRAISTKNWLPAASIPTASFTNPLMDEARGLYEDANRAADALLASFPRSLRTSADQSDPVKTTPSH
ncbi:MAG: hypothetical protein IID30_10405 [Planctomycetes bacterium]|nr:hypothetical protein [Planctomycetota bacterium]